MALLAAGDELYQHHLLDDLVRMCKVQSQPVLAGVEESLRVSDKLGWRDAAWSSTILLKISSTTACMQLSTKFLQGLS